jgi:hypothetical protein
MQLIIDFLGGCLGVLVAFGGCICFLGRQLKPHISHNPIAISQPQPIISR